MKNADPVAASWLREALEHQGRLSLASLLERAVPIDALRDLARKRNVPLKGYRIERAPARRVVQALTDVRQPELIEAACQLLLEHVGRPTNPSNSKPDNGEELAAARQRLERREAELEEARAITSRLREQAARQRERDHELQRRLEQETERNARLRAEAEALRRRLDEAARPGDRPSRPDPRVHELERENEALLEADDGLRRLLALRHARIRELEDTVAELEELVPKGRRKKQPKPEAPALAETFRLPHFQPSFYKSLEGKERRAIEQAMHAALLLCTEGPAYPGLEAKPLEGQDLWSIRASLKLRVYFRWRSDSDIDFVMLADREDQHTALRRLKDR